METLRRTAPEDPLSLAERWLAEAADGAVKNPWAMALATVAASGRPSVRYVLLKTLVRPEGHAVFFTNYGSRKAHELESLGHAAGVLYWRDSGRQLRLEGPVERSPAAESDAYFASRPRLSQLNAWASAQSRPLDSPEALARRLAEIEQRFPAGGAVPRPEHWGGYRLKLDTLEFWLEGEDRFHERLRYARAGDGGWSAVWLQP